MGGAAVAGGDSKTGSQKADCEGDARGKIYVGEERLRSGKEGILLLPLKIILTFSLSHTHTHAHF